MSAYGVCGRCRNVSPNFPAWCDHCQVAFREAVAKDRMAPYSVWANPLEDTATKWGPYLTMPEAMEALHDIASYNHGGAWDLHIRNAFRSRVELRCGKGGQRSPCQRLLEKGLRCPEHGETMAVQATQPVA